MRYTFVLIHSTDDHARRPIDDSNALLLPASRKRAAPAAPTPDHQPLSKAQRRKQRRVAEERAARQKQADALATLHAHALPAETASLMRSVAQRGQRLTVKESLRRDLALQRAGLPLPEQSRLVKRRDDGGAHGVDGTDSSDDDAVEVWIAAT